MITEGEGSISELGGMMKSDKKSESKENK
jgi:hypothetical protein